MNIKFGYSVACFMLLSVSETAFALSGTVVQETLKSVVCENVTTGESKTITFKSKPGKSNVAWNCTAAGFKSAPGDIVKQTLIGTIEAPVLKSCKEIIADNPGAESGVYTIAPAKTKLKVYCDMATDGGGWTLVLAYSHVGKSSDSLVLGVPLDPATGHAHMSNAMMQKLAPYTETRFHCTTSGHSRILDFKTGALGALGYIKNGGANDPGYWNVGFTPLGNHSANLPAAANFGYSGQGDNAMIEYPFYWGGASHWSVGADGYRWECDDFIGSGDNSTLHQVWVR